MQHWTAKTWSAREDRRQKLLSMSEERLREIMGPYLNEGAEVSSVPGAATPSPCMKSRP